VLQRRDATADGEGNLELGRRALHQLDDRIMAEDTGGDVEENELVGAVLRVARGHFHRVTDVAQLDEAHALDDASFRDIEAGNQTLFDHAIAFLSRRAPAEPLRSGWN
jgi:hypothetical protein